MALLSEDFNRNIFEIITLINHRHDRMMHYPGSGVGGHCLTKDPWLLLYGFNKYTERINESKMKIIPDARKLNDYMPYHMIELMENVFRDSHQLVDNIKITLLGVSYKANTDDTRNTPTENIVKILKTRYHSHNIVYLAHDPYVKERDYNLTDLTSDFNEAVDNADVLLFTTNHSEYYKIDLDDLKKRVNTPIIIDGRNIFDKKIVEEKGFIYRKVGEGAKKPV
jgi:nucleotide sugar dehydrogenase